MNQVAGATELLGGRFSLMRRLGEGGFGVVYEANDARFRDRVALKLLRRDHAKAIYRFKREFRSLADVVHPNLVRLYELVADGDALYLTMELVDGVDLMTHVCGAAQAPERTITTELHAPVAAACHAVATEAAVLRAVFGQLANGVQALHDLHKLHCDIKPNNVLVARDGRVVLLDFGLVADIDERSRSVVGTPAYMAPEQASTGMLSTASDWYGVGAMLHEALTGELPSPGRPCRVERPELRALAELSTALLDPIPERRPSGREVLARLGATTRSASLRTARLFGRDHELATLRTAWAEVRAGATTLVRLFGGSGIGKTAVAERFIAELRSEPDALVLAGRCFEQESVPYKALDGVVDVLAEHLRRLDRDAVASIIPEHGALLAQLFPVLGHALSRREASDAVDPQAARRRGFLALRELLVRISRITPIACVLDDLQWGDVDSARLFAELVRPPDAPRMLVLASHRPYTASDGFLPALVEQPLGVREIRIELRELGAVEACELASHLLGDRADEIARAIGRESAGSPLFIQQLVAATHERVGQDPARELDLGDVILSRVDALDRDARALVHTIALAGRPIDEAVAIQAAAIDAGAARAVTLAVRHARLVTARTADGAVFLEPAHDRVRETVAGSISEGDARAGHLRIAETLLAGQDADPDALVHHLHAAGDAHRTRTYALIAAERAERALAFDRAAARLGLALELGDAGDPGRAGLLERQGNALASAGRGADAAESFERAAEALSAADVERELSLRRRAGELTLRSGRIELGTARMQRVLSAVGVRPPATRTTANLLALGRRIRLFARGIAPRARRGPTSPAAKARLEALWSASTGVSMVNHVLADALGLQHLLEALALGEQTHLVRGLGYEAAFEAVIGGRFLRARCAKILAAMDQLASASADPYDRAWAQMSRGVTSWFLGDWPAAWRNCDEAAALYRDRCRGVAWELAICDAYRLPALAYLGDVAELARVVPRAYAGAHERGDLYAMNLLRLGQQSMTRLVDDRPGEAVDEAREAVAPFPRMSYLLPHYHHLFALAQAELYRGKPEIAWREIESSWRELGGARFLMVQCLRVEIRHLRARAALALAAAGHRDARRLRAIAAREATRIARDDVAPAAPFAAAVRAAIAGAEGQPARACSELEAAMHGFQAAHMALYAHACGYRLGRLIGGARGATLRQSAASWLAGQSVRNPAALVAMLVPGV